jgi:hypothetical protein
MQVYFIILIIGKTRSEQVLFSGVRQMSVLAGGIVVAMRTIPPVAKNVEFTKIIEK